MHSKKIHKTLINTFAFIMIICVSIAADTLSVELNDFFAKFDDHFNKIASSPTLLKTHPGPAENFFSRELKKHQSYYSIVRVNSKGKVVSQAVRGNPVERSGTDVSNESWFTSLQKGASSFYTEKKDQDRGRYYLIWSKPILKSNRFIGAVCLKIDLWDSFYEFSENIYIPFLVRLNHVSLFSHKWNKEITFTEERLKIPGIKEISVRYIPEKKSVQPDTTVKQTTQSDTMHQDDSKQLAKGSVTAPAKTKSGSSAGLFFIIIIIAVIATIVVLFFIIKNRKDSLFNKINEE